MYLLALIISSFLALVVIAIKYDKLVPPISGKVNLFLLRISENEFLIKMWTKFRLKCNDWHLTESLILYLIGFVYSITSLIIFISLFARLNETGLNFSILKYLYIGNTIITHTSLIVASLGLFLKKKEAIFFLSVALVGHIINFIWFLSVEKNWIDVLTFKRSLGGVFSSWIILGLVYEYCRSLKKKGVLN